MQLQFSLTDAEELHKAQANPDEYRDLMVRITGYSAIFVDMSKGAQEEFIRREELSWRIRSMRVNQNVWSCF